MGSGIPILMSLSKMASLRSSTVCEDVKAMLSFPASKRTWLSFGPESNFENSTGVNGEFE
jgi:hypothetical protein